MILPREAVREQRLVAESSTPERAWDHANRLEADDHGARFAGSFVWCRTAADVLGDDATQHLLFRDGNGEVVGWTMLERATAGWRSGSPRVACLTWPFAAIGYRFRPRFAPGLGAETRADWLAALQAACAGVRLELTRLDLHDASGAIPGAFVERTHGPSTWASGVPDDAEAWYGTLEGKHRRDLKKYRRDIANAGARWCDTLDGAPLEDALDACFALHRRRIAHKGATSACGEPRNERFLRALARHEAARATRVVVLRMDGEPMGACLSFAHHRRLEVTVSGWDQRFARYDLGRQVIHHQILREFARGLDEIDLLGGDLPYKREFGLRAQGTCDVVVRPTAFAAWREDVVGGALRVARMGRRLLASGGRARR